MHLSEMIERASRAVTNIASKKAQCVIDVWKDERFSPEQKELIMNYFNKLDGPIDSAQSAFTIETK